jgi:hypothetical protein
MVADDNPTSATANLFSANLVSRINRSNCQRSAETLSGISRLKIQALPEVNPRPTDLHLAVLIRYLLVTDFPCCTDEVESHLGWSVSEYARCRMDHAGPRRRIRPARTRRTALHAPRRRRHREQCRPAVVARGDTAGARAR